MHAKISIVKCKFFQFLDKTSQFLFSHFTKNWWMAIFNSAFPKTINWFAFFNCAFHKFSVTHSHSLISHFFLSQSFFPLRYNFYLKYQYTDGIWFFAVSVFTNVKFSVLLLNLSYWENKLFLKFIIQLSQVNQEALILDKRISWFLPNFSLVNFATPSKNNGCIKSDSSSSKFLISCEVLTLLLYEYVETNISAASHNFFSNFNLSQTLQKRKLSSLWKS